MLWFHLNVGKGEELKEIKPLLKYIYYIFNFIQRNIQLLRYKQYSK